MEYTRNNFSPNLSKNATQLLKNIYTHLRLIQKSQKLNKLLFLTKINLYKLESIIRISESLSKMRSSNLADCNTRPICEFSFLRSTSSIKQSSEIKIL